MGVGVWEGVGDAEGRCGQHPAEGGWEQWVASSVRTHRCPGGSGLGGEGQSSMRNVGSSVDEMWGWGAEGEGRQSGEEDGGQVQELRSRG